MFLKQLLRLVLRCDLWQYFAMSETIVKPLDPKFSKSTEIASVGVKPPAPKPQQVLSYPPEVGGPKGPEPTRFGDWEKAGRCIDF